MTSAISQLQRQTHPHGNTPRNRTKKLPAFCSTHFHEAPREVFPATLVKPGFTFRRDPSWIRKTPRGWHLRNGINAIITQLVAEEIQGQLFHLIFNSKLDRDGFDF